MRTRAKRKTKKEKEQAVKRRVRDARLKVEREKALRLKREREWCAADAALTRMWKLHLASVKVKQWWAMFKPKPRSKLQEYKVRFAIFPEKGEEKPSERAGTIRRFLNRLGL